LRSSSVDYQLRGNSLGYQLHGSSVCYQLRGSSVGYHLRGSSVLPVVRQFCSRQHDYFRARFHVLDNLFFTEEPWLKLSAYFNSQKGRICSAEQPHALNGNPTHLSKSGFM
jgi:hypothetical protein